jgi:hypothetical protein
MASTNVSSACDAAQVAALLASTEIASLITQVETTRWTGRPGYPNRAMVGAALTKAVYCLPTWTRTVRLIAEHAALRDVLGAAPVPGGLSEIMRWSQTGHGHHSRRTASVLSEIMRRCCGHLRPARSTASEGPG